MTVYESDQIADFMLAKSQPDLGDAISNLKLQKLLYYAAGVFAALRQNSSDPLFHDDIQAWQHGPVVPKQYRRFNQHGSDTIPVPANFDFNIIESHDLAVLDDVYNFYGQYSAWKLRNMTHEEAPWTESFEREEKSISYDQLLNYFSQEVGTKYIDDYYAKQG